MIGQRDTQLKTALSTLFLRFVFMCYVRGKKPRLGNIIDLIFDILNFIHVLFNTSSYMYQRPLLTTFPNTENKVENATGSGIFLTNFEMFGNVVKHCLERLIYLPN